MTKPTPPRKTAPDAGRLRGWRRKLLMACLGPLLVVGGVELGLRLAGFGYPTEFLLPTTQDGRSVWISNARCTWPYFGPAQARVPAPVVLSRPKPAGVVRVYVLGESAAYGDPDPDFGLARMLQALLEPRFPDTQFEVVNAAITGINSHAVLPIARSCAEADGNIWVLYMGNNEVVGPFGGGTVFGPQAPPLPLIRAGLAVKSTRLGEALDGALRRVRNVPADKQEWGGMLMFVDNQVPAQDPRMKAVYHHFERNLVDILDRARRRGVGLVVSTVAVNLRDCAPFASAHRKGLGDEALSDWESLVAQGKDALRAGSDEEAVALFRRAAALDGAAAEVQYLLGLGLHALGREGNAQEAFQRARDLDTLRFRCDGRLNEITRRLVRERAGPRLTLVDAEAAFADFNRQGVTDGELFYDHVHLTFPATYQLASRIGRDIESMLPPSVREGRVGDWPPMEACAERLAWSSSSEAQAVSTMLRRFQDPPFAFQYNHQADIQRLQRRVIQLSARAAAEGAEGGVVACRRALTRAPGDVILYRRLAKILHEQHRLADAEAAARRVAEELPHSKHPWIRLGRILTDRGDTGGAIDALHQAIRLDPRDESAWYSLGAALAKAGRREDAEAAFRRSIEANSRLGPAYLALAVLEDGTGHAAEAEVNLRLALKNRVLMTESLTALAAACLQRKWYPEALTNLVTAIQLSPADPTLCLQAGNCLEAMGNEEEARRYYQQAVTLAPEMGEAHFVLGLSCGRAGDNVGALRHFERAARLLPDLPAARLNLAIAQVRAGLREDAIQSFQEVLQQQPEYPLAHEYLERLQAAPAAQAP